MISYLHKAYEKWEIGIKSKYWVNGKKNNISYVLALDKGCRFWIILIIDMIIEFILYQMENIQIHETHIHAFSTSIHKNCNFLRSQILTIKLLKFGICTKKAFFAISHKKFALNYTIPESWNCLESEKMVKKCIGKTFFWTLVTLYFEPTHIYIYIYTNTHIYIYL